MKERIRRLVMYLRLKNERRMKGMSWKEIVFKDKEVSVDEMIEGFILGVGLQFNFRGVKKNGERWKSEDVWEWVRRGYDWKILEGINLINERKMIVEEVRRYIEKWKKKGWEKVFRSRRFWKGLNKVYNLGRGDIVWKKCSLLNMILKKEGIMDKYLWYGCVDYNVLRVFEYWGLIEVDEKRLDKKYIDKLRKRSYKICKYIVKRYGVDVDELDSWLFSEGRRLGYELKIRRICLENEINY